MKTRLLAITAALLASATISSAAVSVPAGGVTVDFGTTPLGADFASVTVAGGAGDLNALGELGTEIDNPDTGVSASLAWPAGATNWAGAANSIADEPAATALNAQIRYVTNAQKMLTGPTGNRYHALIGRFQNDTGSGISGLNLNWTVGSPFVSAGTGAYGTDPLAGVHVYFSKTGLANSWTRLGGPFGDADGPVGVLPITFAGSIGTGGTFYIAWIDDNGPASGTSPDFEGHYTVDDIVISNLVAATCAVSANLTPVTRQPGVDPVNLADDLVAFSATITGSGTVGPGWRISAGSPMAGTTGNYGTTQNFSIPIADFAGGPLPLKIEDQSDAACFFETVITAPPFIHSVTATNSPTITFTQSTVGDGSYVPPSTTITEPGWFGGTNGAITLSNVQTQPPPSSETLKYFHMTTNGVLLTTDPINVNAVKGALLEGELELALYTTSNTGLDAGDALNFRIELAKDGNFSNTAAGNIITTNIKDVPAGEATAFGDSIAASTPHQDLGVAGYPATDFTFYKFSNSVLVPADSTNPHARIIAESVVGITNSEHVLIDNIVFRINNSPSLNASAAGQGTFSNGGTAVTTDDTFTTPVNVTAFNITGSTGWTSDETPARTGLYADPNPVIFGPYPGRTPVTVVLRDNGNPAITTGPVVLNPPTATLTATLVAGSVNRIVNGAGPGDDTVTFAIDVAATNAGVAFSASVDLLGTPGPSSITGAGNYPAVGTPVTLTLSNVPTNATTVPVVIADTSYPTNPAPVTVNVAIPVAATPGIIGRKDFGGGLTDVTAGATAPPEWAIYSGTRETIMSAGLAADSVLDSEVIDLTSVGAVNFTAELVARETSAGSNFESTDRFKAELIINGDVANPISVIPSTLDVGDGALSPAVNGPPNGFINGYTGTPDEADYNTNLDRDEFNTGDEVADNSLNNVINLSGLVPASANNVQLRITGAGVTGSEALIVRNVLFSLGVVSNDTDGDGESDPDELIAGTSPTNPTDVLRLTSNPATPNVISFPTKADRFYRVYVSDDANEASHLAVWKDAGLATIVGNGTPGQFSVTVTAGETRRYYRVHVMQTDGVGGVWPATYP